MRSVAAALVLLVAPVCAWTASFDLATADREVRALQAKEGNTPRVAEAYSELARAALSLKQFDRADAYASEARKLAVAQLGVRRIDSDQFLPLAVGAAIEVHAHVLAEHGEIPEALAYLRQQFSTWRGTSLEERIQKNINLLNLEGKPAPPLEGVSLAAFKGRPVLLFFWAHWCPDCKADVPVIAAIEKKFGPRGLVLIGPTRLYGYVAGGEPAPAAAEANYIEQIRRQYYQPLGNFPDPVSAANFQAYGASTTPTFVLIDRTGVVRYYHPGAITEPELTQRIQAILR